MRKWCADYSFNTVCDGLKWGETNMARKKIETIINGKIAHWMMLGNTGIVMTTGNDQLGCLTCS